MLKIFNNRVCYRCGSDKTYISPSGYESWYKDYDNKGNFTGRYSCHICHLEMEKEKTKKCKEVCCSNRKNKTHTKEDEHIRLKGSYGWIKEKAKEYGFGDNIREFVVWGNKMEY